MTEKWAFLLSFHHNFHEITVLLATILSQESAISLNFIIFAPNFNIVDLYAKVK